MTDNGHAAVTVVPLDAIQTLVGRCPITFDTLHEIEPVKQNQAGNTAARVVTLRRYLNRQQIFLCQARPGGTHINEGGDQSVGHI